MKYKLYEVGGKVRDYFLGLSSKDVDYSVVIEDRHHYSSPREAFDTFSRTLVKEGFEIFLETPDVFTIRAKFPKDHKYSGVADFVIARKEVSYGKLSRKPNVVLGTLEDDLLRRDFTVNAMAIDDEGNLIDLFNGAQDLRDGVLRTPSDAAISFNSDPLRILRAMRFAITKDLLWSDEIIDAIKLFDSKRMSKLVSNERIREELFKMFKSDTIKSLDLLVWIGEHNKNLYSAILNSDIRLEPTMKK